MHEQQVEPSRDIRSEWTEFLGRFQWTHIAHLTTRLQSTEAGIAREFLNGFIRRAARRAGNRVPYFYSIESLPGGFPHLHALIGGTKHLSVRELECCWKVGFTRVTQFDADRGGVAYVSKDISLGPDAYSLSSRLGSRLSASVYSRSRFR